MSESDALEAASLVRAPGNPGEFTVWGVVNALTSAAKAGGYADERFDRSAVAGRVLAATA
jgi:hypothetical protein